MMMPPKKHLVIPARLKSTRLPNKPLLLIHGKPMIVRVYEKAKQVHLADDICVATDDEHIAKVCREVGADVVMTHVNHASGTDRLAQVADIKGWHEEDIVINMQGDEPLVPAVLIEQVTELLIKQPECVMATLAEHIHDLDEYLRPSVVKVVKNQHNHALYFSRSPIPCDRNFALAQLLKVNEQHQPANNAAVGLALRHLGLYAYRVKLLHQYVSWQQGVLEQLESLEQLRVLENGGQIAIDIAKVDLPVGVDTQADLDRLNALDASLFAC